MSFFIGGDLPPNYPIKKCAQDSGRYQEFYDWCDSTTAEIAQLARWILDSGRYDELFATGDGLAVDAFEFLPETHSATQRALLREVATALKRRYRQLSRAAVVVHPHHFGEPPRIDSGSRRVRAYRRALDTVMQMAQELRLGERLSPRMSQPCPRDKAPGESAFC